MKVCKLFVFTNFNILFCVLKISYIERWNHQFTQMKSSMICIPVVFLWMVQTKVINCPKKILIGMPLLVLGRWLVNVIKTWVGLAHWKFVIRNSIRKVGHIASALVIPDVTSSYFQLLNNFQTSYTYPNWLRRYSLR